MVSVCPNPPASHQDFYYYTGMGDPTKMGLPGSHSFQPETAKVRNSKVGGLVGPEDPSKRVRKPYTITKSRESWTDEEHDKFLEALHLFDRDWKKIEAFVGSKTVIQIRSHAQKYFLKVQKSGTTEHVPPPRPKRKAAHPYPQKAPKTDVGQNAGQVQPSSSLLKAKHAMMPDSLSVPRTPLGNTFLSPWAYCSLPMTSASSMMKDDMAIDNTTIPRNNSCSINVSSHLTPQISAANNHMQKKCNIPTRVTPDFAQVYSFLGSVFDPSASDHLDTLRKMDPINVETVLMLMKNLSVNLVSSKFENHRRVIGSYSACREEEKEHLPYRSITF